MKRQVSTEAYFTSREYAVRCVNQLEKHFDIDKFDCIVEPSAGTGVFVDLLNHKNIEAIDLEPRHPKVEKADFFCWYPRTTGRILTIGNPPFGQRAALATRFLNRSADFSDVVAMILPRSFKKYTFQNRVNSYFHLVDSIEGSEFVDERNKGLAVKTVFQIWERRSTCRPTVSLPDTHPDFDMRHAHMSRTSSEARSALVAEYPFAIPQVGSNFKPRQSGQIVRGSWWFIRPRVEGVRNVFELLDFGFNTDLNTAHSSIGKRDIVRAYIEAASSRDTESATE